jgi:hypothetical protein
MALDTTNLSNFLKGITDAIRKKKRTTGEIQHSKIDEEIESIDTLAGYKAWRASLCYNRVLTESISANYTFYSNFFMSDEDLKNLIAIYPIRFNLGGPKLYRPAQYTFYNNLSLTSIPKMNLEYALISPDSTNIFVAASRLKRIEDEFVCSAEHYTGNGSETETLYASIDHNNFSGTLSLSHIKISKETLYLDSDLSWARDLDDESRQSLIDGLAKVEEQRTFRFHSSVVEKFTKEQLLEASNKNWNIG